MSEQQLRVRCTRWQLMQRGSLIGYATIELTAYGVAVVSVQIFVADDGTWRAGIPAHPILGTDGSVLLSKGKPKRIPSLSFTDEAHRDRFLKAAAAAVCVVARGTAP
jgi:hypothetical protein